ncbi:MAG: DUF6531 domain-containing protein, partial [Candidatus Baltobacteraceae bacterium]
MSGSAQTANATDRIAVKFYVTNTSVVSQSFSYAAGQGAASGLSLAAPPPTLTYEADTTAGPTSLFYAIGGESGAISQIIDATPTGVQTNESLSYSGNLSGDSWGWVSPTSVPNATSWPAQSYNVLLNISQTNSNLQIYEVKVYRVDSSGGPSTSGLAVVGDLSGLAQSLGTAGTVTFNVSGSAQTASSSDRLGVKFYTKNTAMSTQSFSYAAGQGSGSGIYAPNAFGGTPPPTPAPTATPTPPPLGGTPPTTGINPYWTYEEGGVQGIGRHMVNVATGNLIVQADDIDIPERGIDLAFRRTYNSQSQRDWTSQGWDDGSPGPGMYGNGWTNTFDAHLALNNTGGISVYDIDGARYDWAPSGTGCQTPPVGEYGTLCYDGGSGYQWTKKNGTVYWFYIPTEPASVAGYSGRLYRIEGRNRNNYIQFNYTWKPDASTSANLDSITASHSDGQALTLNFGPVNGVQLLSNIVRPDGATVLYYYDGKNNLSSVSAPANNSGWNTQSYGWTTGYNNLMQWAASPRWTANGQGQDGGYSAFGYIGSTRQVNTIQGIGIVN